MRAKPAHRFLPALAGLGFILGAAAADDPMADGVARGHAQWHQARTGSAALATIAIIIDDLGQQRGAGLRAIELPGAVALSYLPDTAFAHSQAELAWTRGKEVLLHLPMEPGGHARAYPTAITRATGEPQLDAFFEEALASVPHARGVNNHQGSLMTELPEPMNWLMARIKAHPGLYFVDSRTTGASVAYRVALAHHVPAGERSVFLDDDRSADAIRAQFHALLARAHQNGHALAIGHPNTETLNVLEEELPKLAAYGVRLVAPSEMISGVSEGAPPFKQLKFIESLSLATMPSPPAIPGSSSAAAH